MEQLGFHYRVIIILSSFKLRPEGTPNTKTTTAIKGGVSSCDKRCQGLQISPYHSTFPEVTRDTFGHRNGVCLQITSCW